MLDKLEWAEFVLLICTETYYRRFRGHEVPERGRGVDWEGQLITLEIYNAKTHGAKFVPVIFGSEDRGFIPEPLSDHVCCLDSEESYQELYGFLTGQAGVPLPELGPAKQLPRKGVEPLNFGGSHLPKLAEADVKAVGSSLPGKLLGRTAALVSLVLLVLFLGGSVDTSLKQFLRIDLSRLPWLHYGLLFGLPLLAIVSQLLVEWQAERSRRALQRLAVRVGAEQSGYFRIGPYLDTAADRAMFGRADRAHEKVLNWIERSASMPLFLTGDSGSGKSSLLNASVLPALRERGWVIVEVRAWQDPPKALRDALEQLLGARPSRQMKKPTLRDVIEAAARRAGQSLLLVLDQFEEFVILGKPEQKQQFANLLADLQVVPVKGVRLLLVLRSDYQTFLDDIGLPSLRYGENLYQVGRFMFAAAGDFLVRSGLELQPAAVDRLLTSAAELGETPGLVRPITLNVIGYVLAAGKAVAPSLDAGQLVRRYIEQTVGQPAIRDFAPRVLEQLVTEQGTKRPQSEEELAASTDLRSGEVRAVLNGLGAAALARPLDLSQGVWELSHDFIARAVARYLGRRRGNLLHRSASYAAPALLIAMLVIGTGVIAWIRLGPDQIRTKLAELGLTVTPKADGLAVERNSRLTSKSFVQAGPLLAKLAMVRSLDLTGTEAENLEPFEAALQELNLPNTTVDNIKPLKGLTALRELNLANTTVDNIEPLKDLTALRELNLANTTVDNIEPLRDLSALRKLVLNKQQVGNLEPLNLEPLKSLTALESLDLGAVEVSNLEPIRNLTALRTLILSGAKNVGTLEPLKGLTALESLNLEKTRMSNLEPLKGLTALQSLNLQETAVDNIEPLRSLTALRKLNLRSTRVGNLEPLKGLTALEVLDLSGTGASNLEPLKGLTALRWLDLSFNNVENLEPLRGLTALQSLSLVKTNVQNLEPLEDLTALRKLYGAGAVPESERRRFKRYRRERKLQPVEM